MYCTYCGKHTHEIENCPSTFDGSINRTHMFCTYCGDRKHNIKACPKTHGGNAARAWDKASIKKDYYI